MLIRLVVFEKNAKNRLTPTHSNHFRKNEVTKPKEGYSDNQLNC